MARAPEPIRIASREDLERALRQQPRAWSAAVAHRAAMRVTPLWKTGIWGGALDYRIIGLLFRWTTMSRIVALNPTLNLDGADGFTAARAANRATSNISIAAFAAAAGSADGPDSPISAAYIVANAAAASAASWRLAEHDLNSLRAGTTVAALLAEPFGALIDDAAGAESQADPLAEDWRTFKAALHAAGPHWALWTEWWEAMRDGAVAKPLIWGLPRAAADAVLTSAALWPETKWTQRAPEEVNQEILALIEAKRAEFAGADDAVEQGEGPYRFEEVDGRIVGRPGAPDAFDEALAATLRDELLTKLEALLPKARGSNTSQRIVNGLERLRATLGAGLGDVSPGILLSASRTVLNDAKTFGVPEARNENLPEVLSAIGDVADTLEDFMAAFPSILRIERDRLALALLRNRERLEAQRKTIAEIQQAADVSDAVDASARRALHRFDAAANEAENLDLLAALVADQVLVVRAFAAQTANSLGRRIRDGAAVAGTELAGLGGDLWKATRTGLPKGWEDGAKRFGKRWPELVLLALGVSIAGHVGALAAGIPALSKVASKLAGWVDELRKAQALENEAKRRKLEDDKDQASAEPTRKPAAKKPAAKKLRRAKASEGPA